MRFGDPGNPVKEECKWRNTNYFRRQWCFGGKGGGCWGSSFEIGGSAVVRTTILGGHIRDGGSHRVDVGVALEGARRRKDVPRRPSGHPRGDTFECRCGTAYGCILCVPVPSLL